MPSQTVDINALIDEGFQLHKAGNLQAAEQKYKQALAIDPNNAEVYQLLGNIADATKNHHAATELFRRSLTIDPAEAEVWISYAKSLTDIREDKLAIKALQKAIEMRPNLPHAHLKLGVMMIAAGKPNDAPQHLWKALSISPDYGEVYRVLATLGEIAVDSQGHKKINGLLSQAGMSAEKRYQLHYALANIYKKTGDKTKFAKHLFEANRAQSECAPRKEAVPLCSHDRIIKNFTSKNLKKSPVAVSPNFTPIFIVGLPRSGTTLVERIVAAHPLVEAGEELQYLRGPALKRLMSETGKLFPDGFQDLTQDQVQMIASEYSDRTQRLFPTAKFITDKNLGNFLAIGLIKIILPNAKIIALHRDPMDTAFSILQNTFVDNMRYCCDLEKLAVYYNEYNAQIKHWKNFSPGFVLDVQYEDLIKNQKGQTKRMLEFCGLDWDANCLKFFQNEKAVRTLSAGQVRQPIYSSSMGAWKKYRKELAPLAEALGDLVVD